MSVPPQPPPGGYDPQPGVPQYGAVADDPGRTMGIVGIVLGLFGCVSIVGLIVSILSRKKSKAAGFSGGVGTAGIVVSSIVLAITIIVSIVMGITLGAVIAKCAELGPGVHVVDGITYTCG